MRTAVVGAGAWGTTLAAITSAHGPTTLWAREPEVVNSITARRENTLFLPGFTLPSEFGVTLDLRAVLDGADVVIIAVPSPHVRTLLGTVPGVIGAQVVVVSVTKGLEAGTGKRMTEVISETIVGHDRGAIGVLAGPNLAREVMAGHPSATCVAFSDLRRAIAVQHQLTSDRLRVYTSTDVIGCEISGAVKNVIAIAAGMADGLRYGTNTKAALVTRGLAELARLGTTLGGDPLTFLGLTGAGDLMATCASPLSRNRQLGERLAQGRVVEELASSTAACAEGTNSVGAIVALGDRHGVELPICEEVAAVLAGRSTPQQAVSQLMGRPATTELHDLDRRGAPLTARSAAQ